MPIAIRVENISKRYKIGLAPGKFQYGMLRDQIVNAVQTPFRLASSLFNRNTQYATRNTFYPSPITYHASPLPSISSLTSSNRSEITWLDESRPIVMP